MLEELRDGCTPSCAPRPFDETPNMSTLTESKYPSGEYRLYGEFKIEGRCDGSTVKSPYWTWKNEKGGLEDAGLSIYGVADLQATVTQEGGAWVVNYVLSGKPDSFIKALAFTPVKSRSNKHIWQKGQVIMGCTSSGVPTAWLSTGSSVWKGSAFPTHNVSLWNANSSGPTGTSPRQALKKNQGKLWELWDLDSVPSP